MPKPSDLSPKQRHDIERQSRAHIVRLDEEEQALALKAVAKRKDVTSIGGLLRALLRDHLGLGPKVRK